MTSSCVTKSTVVVTLLSEMGSPGMAKMTAHVPTTSTNIVMVNHPACNLWLARLHTGQITIPTGVSPHDASQARAATTSAVTPISRVGWMTGAKLGW